MCASKRRNVAAIKQQQQQQMLQQQLLQHARQLGSQLMVHSWHLVIDVGLELY